MKVRHASCQDASGREVNPQMCNLKEKLDRELCNEQLCTHWEFGAWSKCSVTCGEGTQKRDAVCVDRDGRHLESSNKYFIKRRFQNLVFDVFRILYYKGMTASLVFFAILI